MLKDINNVKNIFISKQWIECILKENSGTLSFINIGNNKLPIISSKKFGFKIGGSPMRGWGTSKLSLIDNDGNDIIQEKEKDFSLNYQELIENLNSYKFDHYEFSLGTKLSPPPPGIKLIDRNTYLIELPKTVEDAWKNIGSKTRGMVRKAKKNDVIVRFDADENWILKYWDILEITYAKNKLKVPFPFERLSNLWEELGANNLLFVGAYINEKMIAGAMIPYNNYKMINLTCAAIPDFNKYAPNNLIQWEIIKYGINRNIELYDMYGGGQGPIGKFKKSFGSQYYEFHHLVYENSFAMKTLLKIYPSYIKLRGLF